MGVVVSLVHVHRVRPAAIDRFWTTLSRTEQAEADRVADRSERICARALVRLALSAANPAVPPEAWSFVRDDAGKPRAVGPVADGPAFNLSHAGGLVACAVQDAGGDADPMKRGDDPRQAAAGPLGIDVEPLARAPAILDTVVRAFARSEVDALRALEPAAQLRRAVELWTVKESYLKGIGTGITRHLDRFAVTPSRSEAVWCVDEDARWRVTVREHAEFLIAVATVGERPIVFRDVLPA